MSEIDGAAGAGDAGALSGGGAAAGAGGVIVVRVLSAFPAAIAEEVYG